jgi:hypothetical protein
LERSAGREGGGSEMGLAGELAGAAEAGLVDGAAEVTRAGAAEVTRAGGRCRLAST